MLRDPQDFLPFFEESLRDYISQNNIQPSSLEGSADEPQKEQDARRLASYRIGFEGSFGANYVSPRTLCARFLRSLLCVEGIVTKCTTLGEMGSLTCKYRRLACTSKTRALCTLLRSDSQVHRARVC